MKIKKLHSVFALFLVFCLMIASLASCATRSPDADKNEVPSKGYGDYDGDVPGDVAAGDVDLVSPGAPDSFGGSGIGGIVGQQTEIEYRPGVLTGSEWRDNDHWEFFLSRLNAQDNGWYDIAARWSMCAAHRLHVRLTADGSPVSLAGVVLYGENDAVLWRAVSDNKGNAYLFWNLAPSTQSDVPARVEVTDTKGQTTTVSGKTFTDAVAAGTLEVSLPSAAGKVPTGIDLMFTIDTTGSMADELEYLKAELEDVIGRVSAQSQLPVRTALNFYRDEGDEYVVRYFAFSDVDTALANLRAQSADGGGDYPEAVHTALANGINLDHGWNDSHIKIMILVLDAPPHENPEVIRSLSETIAKAAERGIRIIPVASSGVNTTCQVLFRTYAALTGGTYTFLTDHSGVGEPHEMPDVEEIHVELLNDMLVRIIVGYCE